MTPHSFAIIPPRAYWLFKAVATIQYRPRGGFVSSGFSENKGRYFINSVPIYRFLYCTLSSSVPRYLAY